MIFLASGTVESLNSTVRPLDERKVTRAPFFLFASHHPKISSKNFLDSLFAVILRAVPTERVAVSPTMMFALCSCRSRSSSRFLSANTIASFSNPTITDVTAVTEK